MPRIQPMPFAKRLILNQYVLSLFGKKSFEELASSLNTPEKEGLTDDRVSYFYGSLVSFTELPAALLSADELLAYDQNIVSHTLAMQGKRSEPIRWKYFQYLGLLFTEIYLDRYMSDRKALLESLNDFCRIFNHAKNQQDKVDSFSEDDLRKLAFWSATGSGKTLIMHMNIKQYWHYLAKAGRAREINRILLITPNEGLSRQHKAEFDLSGIQADLFSKNRASLFMGQVVEILDIHKLGEEEGDKTIALDSFESNNLVLVDEGHRGSSSDTSKWLERRRRLAAQGFTFEYSATFGQAVAKNKPLAQEYAKCILFNYSYQYFYNDGYGKDYCILNLPQSVGKETHKRYLTACLLAFYQQKVLFADMPNEAHKFNIENPLWIFVGASVKAVSTQAGREVSDVVDILLFLADFTASNSKREVLQRIQDILSGNANLLDAQGKDIFGNMFSYLSAKQAAPEAIYDDIMQKVFNASGGAASFRIEELKGVDGEIALSIGQNVPFGVINVGDAPKLCSLCDEEELLNVAEQNNFAPSLFEGINNKDSRINILIGSKKFSEGWSSWRVSTMGLLNVGKSEGSQIIQLFGRGVRLQGYSHWLKRHRALSGQNISEVPNLATLETLNVFGVHANYMEQFKKYLADEGVSLDSMVEIIIPTITNLGKQKLKIMDIPEGLNYVRSGENPTLTLDTDLVRHKVTLDYYPRIQSQVAAGVTWAAQQSYKHAAHLENKHVEFLNMEALYFDLLAFKNERAWHNLVIDKLLLANILQSEDWYELLIPEEQMQFHAFEQVQLWQKIASDLLRQYCTRYYKVCQDKWEAKHRVYRVLDTSHPNFLQEYRLLIDKSQTNIISALEEIKRQIEEDGIPHFDMDFGPYGVSTALFFKSHLYQPLLHSYGNDVKFFPAALNDGEKDFVKHLRIFYQRYASSFEDKQLYLLRNMSKGRGVGFFEANNFHPDFILWVLHGNKQYISFVDPKGIRNLSLTNAKFQFCREIKIIQDKMRDKDVILNSFIVSVTRHADTQESIKDKPLDDLAQNHHLLFQEEDDHIEHLFKLLKMD